MGWLDELKEMIGNTVLDHKKINDPTAMDYIEELERRIEYLEQENIENTNIFYEILNRLDVLENKKQMYFINRPGVVKYTDEELEAMCDEAEMKEQVKKDMKNIEDIWGDK